MYQTVNVHYENGVFVPDTMELDLPPHTQAVVVISVHLEKSALSKQERIEAIKQVVTRLRQKDPFKAIKDPVAWQRKVRKDRELPGR